MQDTIQSVLKRTSIFLIVAGILLLLIGAAANFSISSFALSVNDSSWRIVLGIMGIILIGLGVYMELSGRKTSSSSGTEDNKIITFSNRKDYTAYRMSRLRQAEYVDDVSWRFQGYRQQTYSREEIDTKQEEMAMISQVAKKPNVKWRGVALFTSLEHFEREAPLITNISNVGYNFGIYEFVPHGLPPLVGFMIIDRKELLIAYPHKDIRLAIQHPQVVALFFAYFEEIWQSSQKLKQGNNIDKSKIDQLRHDLSLPQENAQ